jgi:hypothetical protein
VYRPRRVRNMRFLLWCIQYSFGIVLFSTTNRPQSHLFNKNIISNPSGSSWYQNIPIKQKLCSLLQRFRIITQTVLHKYNIDGKTTP